MNDNIKVSTITITRERVEYLKLCIDYYVKQTHSNKEMLILYYDDDTHTKEYLRGLDNDFVNKHCIRTMNYKIQPNIHLGALRNYLISKSTGDYIIIWDDDDYHAENRIESQLKHILDNNIIANTLKSLMPTFCDPPCSQVYLYKVQYFLTFHKT